MTCRAHKRLTGAVLLALCIGCAAVIGFGGCGKDSTTPPTSEDLKGFIDGISPFPPPPSEFDQQIGATSDTTIDSEHGVSVCSVEKFEMGRNMDEIVAFNPNAATLWPGSIVQGKYLPDGILSAVSVARAPLTVGIPDLPGLSADQLSRTIEDPTGLKVAGALNDIIDTFLASGGPSPTVFAFSSKETYDFEQGLLDLGVSVDWAGGNLRSQFGYTWTNEKHTLLLKFTQKYYTAVATPPASSEAYFDPSVTVADLRNYTADGNPLCYVSSVTYGRIGILEMMSVYSESKMKASVNAAFNDIVANGSIDVHAEYAKVLGESEMKMLILGGKGTSGVVSLTNPIQGLMDWINQGLELNNETRGVPIAYAVCHLKDNSMARFQYTHEFTRRICAWADQPVYVSVYTMECTGNEGGFYPALEGTVDIWLTTHIPGLDDVEKHVQVAFSGFDEEDWRDITNASWDNPMPKQDGAWFSLRIKVVEIDDVYDDDLGDRTWTWTYPGYNQISGSCSGSPSRCTFSSLFQYDTQKIVMYFKVNLDGNP